MKVTSRCVFLLFCVILILPFSLSACNLMNFFDKPKPIYGFDEKGNMEVIPDASELGDPGGSGVYMDIEEAPADPVVPGEGASNIVSNLPLKPVGFINVGTINATVQPWSYIPLDSQGFQNPPETSTVSSAFGGGGNSPNTSSYLSLPLGTYTWCIDWEEEDKDGDGYFDYYHYIETATTLLDESDSDDLEFAEKVTVSAPPDNASIYSGKCGMPFLKEDCTGKTTFFKSFVGNVFQEPIYPLDAYAYANTAFRIPPTGIEITTSSQSSYHASVILNGPDNWIEASTSDPYSAIGVSIFGDQTIGWARVLFDGAVMWEGDTSECVIDPDENSGLGWYGLYAEAVCITPGRHTIRVESGPNKEGVGGWQGGVPIQLFGFRW
jgi:hypothetical protein